MKTQQTIGFADLAASRRKVKEEFFNQINQILDWKPIEKLINSHYQKGESVTGRPSYEGIVLFKMTLLQTWYGLSDYQVEEQVNDRISFSRFVGISMDGSVPDNSVISRFRTVLTEAKVYDKLLILINKQLESHGILVRTGAIVDASITDTPRRPRGKKEYEAVEDRKETDCEEKPSLQEKIKPHVDKDARWVKKAGKLRFGFKQHTAVDRNGLVLGVVTTSANESDMNHLEDVLDKIELPEKAWVKADKGYKSKDNDEVLEKKKLRNHIMFKATKSKALSKREIQFNKGVSRLRYKVERTFGSTNRWFGAGIARYVEINKMHTQHLMQAIAYNLYCSPGIVMSCCRN